MLRAFKTREFSRFARRDGLSDDELTIAVEQIECGLVDAHLGGFLIKKRIAKNNRGKSHGWRAIVAHRQGDRLFFLYLFPKSVKDNISPKEKLALSEFGEAYMNLAEDNLDSLVAEGVLVEVKKDDESSQPQKR